MVMSILRKFFGSRNDREIRRIQIIVDQINLLENSMKKLGDDELRSKTDDFKSRIKEGLSLDEILPEAFAVVRESGIRTLQMRHFDVQLIGGIILHEGKIAEMKTGEGKTLAATLPVYLNSLEGKGVHV
ncbi:MAG: preprotein translocase subunit SecA, partial [Nitrospinaceae bacterium]